MLPNADVVAALFAVWRAGGVYVPLNPRLGASDLAHVVEAVEPSIIVTTSEHVDRFGDRPVVVLADDGVTLRPGAAGDRRFDPEVALVQLTSGTTGRPKPVLLEHTGVLALLDNVIATLRTGRARPVRPPMPNLIPVSLSLWAGIYQVLFARIVGAPVVVMDEFDAAGVRPTRRPLPDPVHRPAARRHGDAERRRVDHVARAAEVRAQHHRAAVAAPGAPVPRSLRALRPQRLRPDRDRWRDRRVERGRRQGARRRQARARSAVRTPEVEVRTDDVDRRAAGAHPGAVGRVRRRHRPERPAHRRRLVPHRRRRPPATTTGSCGSRAASAT